MGDIRQTDELCSNLPKISIPPQKIDIDNNARFGYTEGYCLCGAAGKAADLMGLKSPAVNFPVRTAIISGAPFW